MPWLATWGLHFGTSVSGDVDALEQAFWTSREAAHQATAAVLSAGKRDERKCGHNFKRTARSPTARRSGPADAEGRGKQRRGTLAAGPPWLFYARPHCTRDAVRASRPQMKSCSESSARGPPNDTPLLVSAGVALVHGLLAFKLHSQGQGSLVSERADRGPGLLAMAVPTLAGPGNCRSCDAPPHTCPSTA